MQQCLRGAWRVCPNTRTMHGTGFVPQLRNVLRAVFKSAFTDVFRSVFGSTTNRATGACRVKDGYQRHSCLASGGGIASGKATRCVRDTTPRAPGRCSAMPGMPGLSGANCTADPKCISSFTHRLRLWLDARYVVGDVGRSGPGSLLRLGSDAGSSPSSSHPCLPAKLQHVCSPVQPYPILIMAASSGKIERRISKLFHWNTIPNSTTNGWPPTTRASRSPSPSLQIGHGFGCGRAASLPTS